MSQRIIFAGTPDFAAVHLKALLEANFEIVAVYTQPDRPAGRGHKLTPSPVKSLALEHNLLVFTPVNFKDEADIAAWESHQADLAIVVAYGLILPERVLNAPRLGCINVHGSLLPKWRGAAPIQRALLSGDPITGVTIMQIVKALDAGAMLVKRELTIAPEDTSSTLFERLATLGASALVDSLPAILEQKISPEPQDEAQVTYAQKLTKDECPLDFTKSAAQLSLQVRGLNPWPVATCKLADVTYKVFAAKDGQTADQSEPGTILEVNHEGIVVACGHNSALTLVTIQAPGKGKVAACDLARSKKDLFARGNRFA